MGFVISLVVTFWVSVFIIRNYKPQPILFIGGLVMMFTASALGLGEISPLQESTGLAVFDAFDVIKQIMSSRIGNLGVNIMAVGGFARYMDHIGASRALVNLSIQPLLKLKAPYVIMAAAWGVGMLLGLCITSASGLAMLLMVTMFPILVNLGVSRLSATAVIATTLCLDWSPIDTGALLSAQTAGLEPVEYWVQYQIPVTLCVMLAVGILHYVVQKWFDKRDGHNAELEYIEEDIHAKNTAAPRIYACLPVLPLVLIIVFSDLCIPTIDIDISKAMFIGLTAGIICEYIRYRDGKRVLAEIQAFFDGLGQQMANVITLIVAGETFARGLLTLGTIDAIIQASQNVGVGAGGMMLVMVAIIVSTAILMGSCNVPFFTFAALTPAIAGKFGIASASMLLPMHFAASIARSISPISAVIVVSSCMGGVGLFDLVKRTAIPMAGGLLVNLLASFFFFYR